MICVALPVLYANGNPAGTAACVVDGRGADAGRCATGRELDLAGVGDGDGDTEVDESDDVAGATTAAACG